MKHYDNRYAIPLYVTRVHGYYEKKAGTLQTHGRRWALHPSLWVKSRMDLVFIEDKMNRQRITQFAADTLFVAACMCRRTIMRGHGRVNSFNWYTLQNPLTPVDAIIPSNFLFGIRRPSQIIAIAHFPEDI